MVYFYVNSLYFNTITLFIWHIHAYYIFLHYVGYLTKRKKSTEQRKVEIEYGPSGNQVMPYFVNSNLDLPTKFDI
jgi:hypothetical protein